MQIRFHCPTEGCVALIDYAPLESAPPSIECPRCHQPISLHVTDTMRSTREVDKCALCEHGELFTRKDFPQKLGLLVVVLAGISSIYWFNTNFLFAYGILAAAVVVDVILYMIVGKVVTCYACRAEYRQAAPGRNVQSFDLAKSEKY